MHAIIWYKAPQLQYFSPSAQALGTDRARGGAHISTEGRISTTLRHVPFFPSKFSRIKIVVRRKF